MYTEGISASPTSAPTPIIPGEWYESAEYVSPSTGSGSKFGEAVSMHTEFFVVGSPTSQVGDGARTGSISIFNVYSSEAISTVSIESEIM